MTLHLLIKISVEKQFTANHTAICHLLQRKRSSFTLQKAIFYNAKDGLLQHIDYQYITLSA